MKKSFFVSACILFFLFISVKSYSGDLGISYGTSIYNPSYGIFRHIYSYYPYSSLYSYSEADNEFPGPVQNIFLNIAGRPVDNLRINISVGYAFNNSTDEASVVNQSGSIALTNKYNRQIKISGYPIETGVQFLAALDDKNNFEAFIGAGLGYCNLETKLEEKYDNNSLKINYETKGFAQFFTLGLNLHLNKSIFCFIELKKMGWNSLKTETTDVNIQPPQFQPAIKETIESDSQPWLKDLGISFGISLSK